MLLRKLFALSFLILGLGVCSATALAQQVPQNNPAVSTQQPRRDGLGRRGMRRRARMGRQQALEQINLTDAQKQQMRTIVQTRAQGNQAQRAELRQLMQQWRAGTLSPEGQARAKALRGQMMDERMATHTQMMGVLTTEQKAKLQEIRETRKANHQLLRRRRAPLE